MGRKKITIGLSVREIDRTIKELEDYKREIQRKAELLRERVAERLAEEAQRGFAGAVVDDVIVKGARTPKYAQVEVSVDNRGNVSVVAAKGEDAVWVEFGAGVYHNGSPGSSPHPHGAELGFTIGDFGKGSGQKRTWGYYDDNGELKLTHGTPAVMPMTRAAASVCNEIVQITKEVFR